MKALLEGTPQHQEIAETLDTPILSRRLDYNAVAVAYNALNTNGILLIPPCKGRRPTNIRKALEQRGLDYGQDYFISRTRVGEVPGAGFPLALVRLSRKGMRASATLPR